MINYVSCVLTLFYIWYPLLEMTSWYAESAKDFEELIGEKMNGVDNRIRDLHLDVDLDAVAGKRLICCTSTTLQSHWNIADADNFKLNHSQKISFWNVSHISDITQKHVTQSLHGLICNSIEVHDMRSFWPALCEKVTKLITDCAGFHIVCPISDAKPSVSLLRGQSEKLHQQFVVDHEYRYFFSIPERLSCRISYLLYMYNVLRDINILCGSAT